MNLAGRRASTRARGAGPLTGAVGLITALVLAGAGATVSTSSFTSSAGGPRVSASADTLRPPGAATITTTCVRTTTTPVPEVLTSLTRVIPAGSGQFSIPAGVSSYDTVYVSILGIYDASHPVPPTPAGWDNLATLTDSGMQRFQTVWQHRVRSDDPPTYTFGSSTMGLLMVVRGGTLVTDGGAGRLQIGQSTLTAPGVSGVTNGLLMSFWSVERAGATVSGSSDGSTRAYSLSNASDPVTLAVDTKPLSSDGPVAARTTDLSYAGAPIGPAAAGVSFVVQPKRVPFAAVTWSATPSTFATGYDVVRDQRSPSAVSGRTTTSWSDPIPLEDATTSYTVRSVLKNWRSAADPVSVQLPVCP